MPWSERIRNEVWANDQFLPESEISRVVEKMRASDVEVATMNEADPVQSFTYYHFLIPTYDFGNDQAFVESIRDRLNPLFLSILGKTASLTRPNPVQLFAKAFGPESVSDLHSESIGQYGEVSFILYLTDETSAPLYFPGEAEVMRYLETNPDKRAGWKETVDQLAEEGNPIRFIGPHSILPKRNRCVVFRTGSAHLVNPLEGPRGSGLRRLTISGWPFADRFESYLKR